MKTKTHMKKKTKMKKEMKKTKRPKITGKMQKHKKREKKRTGFEKKSFWQFPRTILKAKEGNIAKTILIQNEKKRKGFEKKLLVAIPKDQDHFETKEGTMKMPKGEKAGMKKQ